MNYNNIYNFSDFDRIRRDDIFFAELPTIQGRSHIQQGFRPVLVVANNMNNKHSPTLTVVPLTSSQSKAKLPTHIAVDGYGLTRHSTALCEQILTIDKPFLGRKIGHINEEDIIMQRINTALLIQLGLLPASAASNGTLTFAA